MSKTRLLTIKLPSEVDEVVLCKLCNQKIRKGNGFIAVNSKGKALYGVCILCDNNLN